MAPLGPWDEARRVAVAVSGGADSLALAVLAAGWGRPVGLVVDHGLRAGSAAEAAQARATLASIGVSAEVLTLRGLAPGAGLPARARAARYAALEEAAAAAGLVDLLLGHHAGDQAETVAMRRRAGSGPAGLAGMAAVREGTLIRYVRPLLALPAVRLRATAQAAGLHWAEDPTNHDAAFTRPRLRAELAAMGQAASEALLAEAASQAAARRADDLATRHALAARATIFPQGYAILTPGPVEPGVVARLLRAISGRAFPQPAAVAAWARAPRPATLGGVQILPAGRHGPGWLLVREAAGMAAPVPFCAGAVWDGRFAVLAGHDEPGAGEAATMGAATLGALGADAAAFRGRRLPSAVLRTLPAVRRAGMLSSVPFLAYTRSAENRRGIILRHFASPACGAPFMAQS